MRARIDANGDAEFSASGREAVLAQARVLEQHIRSRTLVQVVAYAVAALFVIVASLLIVLAPDGRETATWIVGGSLLVISAGVAGFTKLGFKTAGMEFEASSRAFTGSVAAEQSPTERAESDQMEMSA